MADEYVLNQLSPKEKIEYEHKAKGVTWFATNMRVLRFKRGFSGDKSLRDLDYRHIVSINVEEKRYFWALIISAFLLIVGIFSRDSVIFATFTIVAVIVGILAVFYRPSYYQFNAPSIRLEDWKMKDTKTKQGKELIQSIRKNCFFEMKDKS